MASFKESNFIQGVTMCHAYSTLRRFAFQNLRCFKAINSGYTAAQYSSIPPKNGRRTTPQRRPQKRDAWISATKCNEVGHPGSMSPSNLRNLDHRPRRMNSPVWILPTSSGSLPLSNIQLSSVQKVLTATANVQGWL